MTRIRLVGPALVLAIALATGVAAGSQSAERVLYVTALDAASRAPVESLAVEDVRVTEDGRPREVLRVAPATTPLPVALLIDNQQAVQQTIADTRNAVGAFIRAMAGVGPIALITVADRPTILQDYTTDTARLLAATNRIFAQPDSGALMLEGIVEVSRGLQRRTEDRAAIVLVTSELTEFSTLHFSQVLGPLKSAGAMLSAVVLTNQQGSMQNDAARNRAVVLDRGVTETGGLRLNVLTSQAYTASLGQIAAALKAQHRVVYARPDQLIPPERVQVSGARDALWLTGAPARGQKER